MRRSLIALLLLQSLPMALAAQDSLPPAPVSPPSGATGDPVVPVTLPPKPARVTSVDLHPAGPPMADSGGGPASPGEVDQMPTLDSVQHYYFPKGKLARKARVVMRAVIDAFGRVEPESIKLVSASDSSFFDAARFTMMAMYFHPGTASGHPVRVLVQQPIIFAASSPNRCELNSFTPMLPPKC